MSDDNKMPEAVKLAIKELLSAASFYRLEAQRDDRPIAAADALESWWRTHAQPVAVGMTEELDYLVRHAEESCKWANEEIRANLIESIAAVRERAAKPQRPKLEKTRRALKCGQERLNIVFLSEETTTRWNNLFYEALAELDAAEKEE